MTASERLAEFIKSKYNSKRAFAQALGIHENSLTKYVGQGQRSVFGSDYLKSMNDL